MVINAEHHLLFDSLTSSTGRAISLLGFGHRVGSRLHGKKRRFATRAPRCPLPRFRIDPTKKTRESKRVISFCGGRDRAVPAENDGTGFFASRSPQLGGDVARHATDVAEVLLSRVLRVGTEHDLGEIASVENVDAALFERVDEAGRPQRARGLLLSRPSSPCARRHSDDGELPRGRGVPAHGGVSYYGRLTAALGLVQIQN